MHIALFKALQSIKVSDDQATAVVEALEEYMAMKIKEANAGLEAQLKAQNKIIGALGAIIAIGVLLSAVAPIIAKYVH